MAAIMTSDLRIVDYYARTLNDSSLELFSSEQVEGFARKRRASNRVLDLELTSQEITGTPLPDLDNTDNGVYYEFIGCFEDIGISTFGRDSDFAFSQTNVYVNGVLNTNNYVDEIAIAVLFPATVTGPVVIRGYILDLANMMGDVFESIAADHAKLAIAQRMLGLSTDLTQASAEAMKMARHYRGIRTIPVQYG